MVDAVVAGAGGMIGGHLVQSLEFQGKSVRAVDIKPLDEWYQWSRTAENRQLDLTSEDDAFKAIKDAKDVYQLASDMGGVKFIADNSAACLLSSLITSQMLIAAQWSEVDRFLFTSSACVYPQSLLDGSHSKPVRESEAYPADPETDYGWEKLLSERLCQGFKRDRGLDTKIARLDTTYATYCTYDGGREKVPAAICRKVALAKLFKEKEIDVWGDGEQTRTFLYVDDTINALGHIMDSPSGDPTNVGADELITINELVTLVEGIAGVAPLKRKFNRKEPVGAQRRILNTDSVRALGWEPKVDMAEGMERLFAWVYNEIVK